MITRHASALYVAAILLGAVTSAHAQPEYPSRSITLVVPLQAGTASDLVARVLAQNFSARTGKQTTIENITGGGGGTGALRVARADPDGHTLGAFNNGVHTILPFSTARLAFDPFRDFAPITLLARFPSVLIASPALQIRSLPELVTLARSKPGKLNYASVGVGSPQHLAMEQLKADAGIDMLHVPYRGGAQATQAIASGEVDVFWIATSVALPFIQAGTVRALAVGESTRTDTLPDVPTVDEAGVKGYRYSPTLALFAPKGTPPGALSYLHREVTISLRDPEVVRTLERSGLKVELSSAAELESALAAEARTMGPLVKKLAIGEN